MFATKSNDSIQDFQHAFYCVIYDRIARRKRKFLSNLVYRLNSNFVCAVQFLLTMPQLRYLSCDIICHIIQIYIIYIMCMYMAYVLIFFLFVFSHACCIIVFVMFAALSLIKIHIISDVFINVAWRGLH